MRYSNRVVQCTDSVRNLSVVGINDRTTGANAEGTVSPVVVLDAISTKIKSERRCVEERRKDGYAPPCRRACACIYVNRHFVFLNKKRAQDIASMLPNQFESCYQATYKLSPR